MIASGLWSCCFKGFEGETHRDGFYIKRKVFIRLTCKVKKKKKAKYSEYHFAFRVPLSKCYFHVQND